MITAYLPLHWDTTRTHLRIDTLDGDSGRPDTEGTGINLAACFGKISNTMAILQEMSRSVSQW
jgi:hypothetical protein